MRHNLSTVAEEQSRSLYWHYDVIFYIDVPSSLTSLKTEFEEQKKVELGDQRRSFTSEQEKKECSYTAKMSQLTAQLQQLDAVVAKVPKNSHIH